MNKIEIHIIAYNEQIMLPFTLTHYNKMFEDKIIIVHDNNSTDQTATIAKAYGCIVEPFTTSGMNDTEHARIKSDAVKNAKADWCLVIDCDELCYINTEDLKELESKGVTGVQFEGWNIFDQVESPFDIKEVMGRQEDGYSKPVLIRTGVLQDIMFAAGAHGINTETPLPGKEMVWSRKEYKLLHYKHWSCDYNLKRSAELAVRQSPENLANRHSYHFALPESAHIGYFNQAMKDRIVITDKHIQNG